MLGEGDRVLETRYIARLCGGGGDGMDGLKGAQPQKSLFPNKKRPGGETHLYGVRKVWQMNRPGLRSLVWSCEAPETTWHYESYMNI